MNWLKAVAIMLLLCPFVSIAQNGSTPSETAAYGYYQDGNEYLQSDNFIQALALAKKGLALSKTNVWCSLLAGQALIGLKQYNNAEPYLRSVQGRLPGNRDIYEAFIELEYGKANFEQVKFYANMALLHFPNDVYFSVVKIDMLDKANKFPDGDEQLRKLFGRHLQDSLLMTAWDEHYKNAASYYQSINSTEQANACERQIGQYPTAVNKPTPIATEAPTSPIPANQEAGPAYKTTVAPQVTGNNKNIETKTASTVSSPPKPTGAYAQPTSTLPDSIKIAKQLRKEGQYKEAAELLKKFTNSHPNDVNAFWLYGETELWLGHINRSLKLYKRATELGKNNDYLLLDYANVLNTAGKIKEARIVLAELAAKGKKYSSATLTIAQRAYWDGDHNRAEKLTNSVLSAEGYDNLRAVKLLKEIKSAKSAWIKVASNYTSDNQPVQSVAPQLSGGKYIDKMFNPQLSLQAANYTYGGAQSTLYALRAANDAVLPKAHISLTAGVGLFGDVKGTQQAGTFKLSARQQIHHFYWQLTAEQTPFVYTPSSIDTLEMAQHMAAAIGWERGSSFVAKAAAEAYFFDDGNRMDILYGWLLLPEIKVEKVGIRVGYGYSYNNTSQNNYRTALSLDSILKDPYKPIAGTYGKYFTPSNQQIQSLLIAVSYKTGKVDLGVNAEVGVAATINNPYIYMDVDENNKPVLKKEFSTEQFTPYGVHAHLNWHLSPATEMILQYSYKYTWFFGVHSADLGFKFNFLNEKKSRKK